MTEFKFPELPDGFEWGADKQDDSCLLICGENGLVSVNFKNRSFRLGHARALEFGDYKGRNWKQELVNDAVMALRNGN